MAVKSQKQIKIQSSKYMNSLFVGNFKASFAGKGIEFQDFREYSPGDDAKYIDWARSSMEGSTIMRRYKEDKSSDILCYVDVRESLTFQSGVKKILLESLLDFLYHATSASGEKFGGYVDGYQTIDYIQPTRNPSSLHKMYNCITRGYNSDCPLDISSLMNPKRKKSIVFVISDSMNIDEKSFQTASLKHDIIHIYISSHFEDTLCSNGVQYLRGTGGNISVDLSDEEKKRKYTELRQNQKYDFSIRLQKLGCDSMCINEKSSLSGEFLKLMKKRSHLAR